MPPRILTLIGARGSGKTAVGRILAARRRVSFLDLDQEIERRDGRPIAEIFGKDGEDHFRALEKKAISEMYASFRGLAAPGGGAVLDPANVKTIRAAGPVVWLMASAETLKARLLADEKTASARPSLTGRPAVDEVGEVLKKRAPLYLAAADAIVDTEGVPPEVAADRVEALSILDFRF